MKLHEISGEIRAIMNKLEETGEITEQQMQQLSELEMGFDQKAEGCAVVIGEFEASAAIYKAEADRLQQKAKAATNNAERMKERLRGEMEAAGHTKVIGKLYNITLGKPSQKLEVFGQFPAKYTETKEVIKEDRRALTAALKSGEKVAGAELVTGKAKLIIK